MIITEKLPNHVFDSRNRCSHIVSYSHVASIYRFLHLSLSLSNFSTFDLCSHYRFYSPHMKKKVTKTAIKFRWIAHIYINIHILNFSGIASRPWTTKKSILTDNDNKYLTGDRPEISKNIIGNMNVRPVKWVSGFKPYHTSYIWRKIQSKYSRILVNRVMWNRSW